MRDALLIAAVILIFWVGYAMRPITVPLLIALGLAYLFEPLIDWLGRKWRIRRTWAVSSILILFVVSGILVVVPTTMLVVSQTADLISNVRDGKYAGAVEKAVALLPEDYRKQVNTSLMWLEENAPWTRDIFGTPGEIEDESSNKTSDPSTPSQEPTTDAAKNPPAPVVAPTKKASDDADEAKIRRIVQDELSKINNASAKKKETAASIGMRAFGLVKSGASQVGAIILDTVEFALLVFLVPFYFFFFAAAYPKVLRFGRQLIPDHSRDRAFFLIGEMDRAVSGFVRGRLVISAILGVILSVGWLIVGVPYSIALGLIVGIFCAVPYLSIIGLPVAIILLAVEQFSVDIDHRMTWWGIILWPTVVYMIAQTLDDWVLTPLIQGKSTNLAPVSIVVAILAGGSIAGIYGMLLAVPVAACIKILLREVLMPRIHEWTEGRASDPLPGGD